MIKNIILFSIILIIILNLACVIQNEKDDKKDTENKDEDENEVINMYYRNEMRSFAQKISLYSKAIKPNFYIIPQNGQELLTKNGEEDGLPEITYIQAIDGVGREELFYGYNNNDDELTPIDERNYMIAFLDIAKNNGLFVFVSDYCYTLTKIDNSYSWNNQKGYISFAATSRELDIIPNYPIPIYNENSLDINTLSDVKNFLYIINPESYAKKEDFLNALKSTNYDLLIIDLFYNSVQLTGVEIDSLKLKLNGKKRLVIAYMSIGEAEDYRYYWDPNWGTNPPLWLLEENPDWPGNYKVKYWVIDWQNIIYGNDSSYLKKILSSNFDGVYLDLIDAFDYFE